MTDAVQELLDLIDIERLEVNIYRGRNRDIGSMLLLKLLKHNQQQHLQIL